MSRKSKKAERKREERRKAIQGAFITTFFALFVLLLGSVGFMSTRANYWGFKKSDDVRTVDAEVIYSSVHSRENEYGTKEYYRRLKVKYEIDGKVYTGNTETKSQLNKGDLCNIKVYKTTEGDYKIPEYTSDTAYKLWSALYIGTVALGVIFLIISIIGFVPEKE